MLIASRFQRPNAPVELPNANGTNTTYFFKPIDPTVPNSEHVAEVTDPKHIQRLLSITEGYYVSEHAAALDSAARVAANNTARPVVPPPATPPAGGSGTTDDAAAATSDPADAQVGDAGSENSADADAGGDTTDSAAGDAAAADAEARKPETDAVADAARALLALQAKQIREQIPKTAKDVLVAALAIEGAKGEHERLSVSKAIRGALDA